MAGAPFKLSARTGTRLRLIPSFDRRQLLMATGSLQLGQPTARFAACCVSRQLGLFRAGSRHLRTTAFAAPPRSSAHFEMQQILADSCA